MSDPMNSEQLAEMVRAAADQAKGSLSGDNELDYSQLYAVADELQRLQAEVVRLLHLNAAVAMENARLQPVVEAVAKADIDDWSLHRLLCDVELITEDHWGHGSPCVIEQAQAALAGEAEHE